MRRSGRFGPALAASAVTSAVGWRARALSASGAATAAAVGTLVLGRLSWRGAVLLGTFFVSSSTLSRLSRGQQMAQRGSRRDPVQVLANGGVAALVATLGGRRALPLAAGSLSAASADTWATEIGATSATAPCLIVSRREVAPGTSGAVTPRGLIGMSAGAALLGLIAYLVERPTPGAARTAMAVAVAGVAGSLADSVLGELVQERRWCPRCEKPTEAWVHRCGEPTIVVGGIAGLTNDVVNVLCTATGALVAGALVPSAADTSSLAEDS